MLSPLEHQELTLTALSSWKDIFFFLADFTLTLEKGGEETCAPSHLSLPHVLPLVLSTGLYHCSSSTVTLSCVLLSLQPSQPSLFEFRFLSVRQAAKAAGRRPLRTLSGWVPSCEWWRKERPG